MANKAPAFQFYARDWLTDTELSRCSPATRGIWIDCLAAMWLAPERGILRGVTFDELARLCRCTEEEARAAVAELKETKTAHVTPRNGLVTLRNRRMSRDVTLAENRRKAARQRQMRKRSRDRHAKVTAKSRPVTLPSASASASAPANGNGNAVKETAGISEAMKPTLSGMEKGDARGLGLADEIEERLGRLIGEGPASENVAFYRLIEAWADGDRVRGEIVRTALTTTETDIRSRRVSGKPVVRGNPGGYWWGCVRRACRERGVPLPQGDGE